MKLIIIVITLSILGMTSGCATITTGTDQSVSVVTEKNVEGAKCELTDAKGHKWYIPSTPGTATVLKGDGPMTVTCTKEDYNKALLMVDETFAGATLGNILIGGGIGIFIDAMSGAAQQYPDQIIVWMEPEEWASEEKRLEWVKEKEAYEEKLAAIKKAAEEPEEEPIGL